jgi:hypothetical protein
VSLPNFPGLTRAQQDEVASKTKELLMPKAGASR